MLIAKSTRFIQAPFDSEEELEQVIIDNYEYIFGPSAIYIPNASIETHRHVTDDDNASNLPLWLGLRFLL